MRVEEVHIPMPDGVSLAANLFVPDGFDPTSGVSGRALPAILEYLPYRKDDGLFERDWDLYSFVVAHGYVGARVDIRGTGRSGGVLPDREYSEQEQLDAEVVIDWLAARPWCSGAVGMWGISWGGFNAIQMAMRPTTPAALKAIIAVDASDELFHDDVHYVDGILHADEFEIMIDLDNARSPAPDFPLDEQTLASRFDRPPWFPLYLRHQRDGAFWRRVSIGPGYERLRLPAYVIGGWYDGYRDSVPRMLRACPGPMRAMLGPWDHSFPHHASFGPEVEWRDGAVRWWDRWLTPGPQSEDPEPSFAVFVRGWHPPGHDVAQIPGEWRWLDGWPDQSSREWTLRPWSDGSLNSGVDDPATHRLKYRPAGSAPSGGWWGDLTPDQAAIDAGCLVYQTAPLLSDVAILGWPRVELRTSVDAPLANWFVRLGDVGPGGSVTLVTGGGASGAQRSSAEEPEPLRPGEAIDLTVELHLTSWTFPAGHRIRVAVSNALFPMAWPTPYRMTMELQVGGPQGSRLVLPVVPESGFFEPGRPSFSPPEPRLEPPGWRSEGDVLPGSWAWHRDEATGRTTVEWGGEMRTEAPWGAASYREALTWIVDDEYPEAASCHGASETTVELPGRTLTWRGTMELSSDAHDLHHRYRRVLTENGITIRERRWDEAIPRDHQ